jgi:hypothetical protein
MIPTLDYNHAAGCTGCTGDHQCSGCGHFRDVGIYEFHGYYCIDCMRAIEQWRRADVEWQRLNRSWS